MATGDPIGTTHIRHVKGVRVRTDYNPPPVPTTAFDWSAYDDRTFDGDPSDKVGYGSTEEEAVSDLMAEMGIE